MALESKWLKRKLEENAYVFGEHLDASARYIASKAPRVLPTSNVLKPGAVSSAAASAVWTQIKTKPQPHFATQSSRFARGARFPRDIRVRELRRARQTADPCRPLPCPSRTPLTRAYAMGAAGVIPTTSPPVASGTQCIAKSEGI